MNPSDRPDSKTWNLVLDAMERLEGRFDATSEALEGLDNKIDTKTEELTKTIQNLKDNQVKSLELKVGAIFAVCGFISTILPIAVILANHYWPR